MLVLILYFLVDAIVSALFSPLAGTISGAAVGIAASIYQMLADKKKGRTDTRRGYWADIMLVCLFVALDIAFDSFEGGHRLMSIVVSVLLLVVFAVSGWTKTNLLSFLTGNILDKVLDSPYIVYLMKNTMRRMTVWASVAIVVYVLSYFVFPRNISEFVDSWFLFIIVPLAFLSEYIVSRIIRRRYKNVEWVPLVSEEGKVVGQAPRPLVHNGSGWLHPVVHLHVFDDRGRILLQKRPAHKKIQPLKWDTAVGGHMGAGEKVEESLKREAREEIGLKQFTAQHSHTYIWKSSVENEYVLAFKTISNGPFEPEIKEEVDELRFWTKEEIQQEINKSEKECNLTPNLCEEMKRLGVLSDQYNNN